MTQNKVILDYTEFLDLENHQLEITGKVYEKSVSPNLDAFTEVNLIEKYKDGTSHNVGRFYMAEQLDKEGLVRNVKAAKENPEKCYYNGLKRK